MDMRALASARIGAFVVLLAAAGLVSAGSAAAAPISFDLCAVAGTTTPVSGADPVPIWGFGAPATPGDCGTATAALPGPQLVVTTGDTVTVTVHNALPGTRTVSLDIPGITVVPDPVDPPPGPVTRTFTFTATTPGTYLYASGGDAGRQQAMGLYGMLIVRPATANQAYDTPASGYDVEAPMVLSVLDPVFNANPDDPVTANLVNYRATWWLINGKSYPDTTPIQASATQRVLLRYANAGFDNTSMALLGGHQRVIARDANLLSTVLDAAAETIPAGATEDTIFTMPSSAAPAPNGFAIYNRQLHVTNGSQGGTSPTPATGGGMMTFIGP